MSEVGGSIRILLLEDHAIFRQALALTFGQQMDLRVVVEAGTLAEARNALGIAIDVAVTDLDLPDGDGADFIRDLRRVQPRAQALVLTASARRRDLARAVAAGAAGVFHKSAPLADVVAAVRRLCAGELLVAPQELVALMREASEEQVRDREIRAALARLTGRERQVLELLAQGLGDKEIAARLGVGIETIKTHTANLFGKLGVESRMQALILAVRYGVVRLN
jgi:DNA-binding NarL/FixJ family response regulator